jgi:hypothetical protein
MGGTGVVVDSSMRLRLPLASKFLQVDVYAAMRATVTLWCMTYDASMGCGPSTRTLMDWSNTLK